MANGAGDQLVRSSSKRQIEGQMIQKKRRSPRRAPRIQDQIEEPEVKAQIQAYVDEIAISIKQSRKLKVEIDRLSKKTQAILDRWS